MIMISCSTSPYPPHSELRGRHGSICEIGRLFRTPLHCASWSLNIEYGDMGWMRSTLLNIGRAFFSQTPDSTYSFYAFLRINFTVLCWCPLGTWHWLSYMIIIYVDHIWWSYDDHIWWLYMMVVWDMGPGQDWDMGPGRDRDIGRGRDVTWDGTGTGTGQNGTGTWDGTETRDLSLALTG